MTRTLTKRAGATGIAALLSLGLLFGCAPKDAKQPSLNDATQPKEQTVEPDGNATAETTEENGKHYSVTEAATKPSTGNKVALSISEINKKVTPSVVAISTVITSRDYFNQERSQDSAGSGVIVSEDGYILTCNHVIADANQITVMLNDKTEYTAEVVGRDEVVDLAVIKIDATGLTPAVLGDSDDLEVGELAVAIGNPLGEFANSLSAGVISAQGRALYIEGSIPTNLLQTDTAISPGNSGGALINSYGEVIGITSAKSSGYDVEGIGFAIPINVAKNGLDDLIHKGYITGHPQMGITGETVDRESSEKYNVPIGVIIRGVESGSAADKAGLQVGDVITTFNDKPIKTMEDLNTEKNKSKAGDTVDLLVMRNGKEYSIKLMLDEMPRSTPTESETPAGLENIPEEFRQYFENRER